MNTAKFKYLILMTFWGVVGTVFAYQIGGKGFQLKYVNTVFTENVYFTSEKVLPIQLVIVNDGDTSLKLSYLESELRNLKIYRVSSKNYGDITGPDEEATEDISGVYCPQIIAILGSKESRPSVATKTLWGNIHHKKYTSTIPEEASAGSKLEIFVEISVTNPLKDGYYQLHINNERVFCFVIRNIRTDYDRLVSLRQKAEAYAYVWWDRETAQNQWMSKALKEIKSVWLPYWWAFEEAESQMDIMKAKEILLEGIKKFPNPQCGKSENLFITDRLVVNHKSRELINGEMVFYDLYEKPFLESILNDFIVKVNFDMNTIPHSLKEKFNKGLKVPNARPVAKQF